MPDLADGETTEMKGSGAKPYVLKNTGGVYSCTCPAWRNQSTAIERRTCKHLRKLRGDAAEEARLGGVLPQKPVKQKSADGAEGEEAGPPLLLAESWNNADDLAGWWMSEKLDGVRAYWDGKQFLSRQGNLFHAPDWFIDGLPDVPLDGELWIDRKKFQRTVSIVRRQDKCDLWSEVRFLVFDAPAIDDVFERRVAFIRETLASRKKPLKFAQPHEHQLCKDLDCLRAELARVEALGGEGLMLRMPKSKYEAGRSITLLKVKRFQDAEAVVTGHQEGLGRHKGRLGALLVKLPSGVAFSVGTGFSDRERSAPPAIGATITFRYQELSEAGVPRFPSYVGVRIDATPATPAPLAPAAPKQPKREVPMSAPKMKVPVAGAASAASAAKPRHFEFVEGNSSKFWEITRSGCDVTTHWGRIGTAGQSKTKTFADEAAAAKEYDKLVEEKTSKGYVES
jgi:DNA ligase-1